MKTRGEGFYTTLLILITVIWGTGFIATQIALDAGYGPIAVLFLRFAVAAIVFGCVFHRAVRRISKSDIKGSLISGGLLFASFMLQTFGLKLSSPANNAFITAAYIAFVPLISWVLLKKRPAGRMFAAAGICLFGVCMLSYAPGEAISFSIGDLLSLGCAFLFAFHILALEKYSRTMEIEILSFMQFAVAAVLAGIAYVLTGGGLSVFELRPELLSIAYLSVFSTCIAFFVQTLAQKHMNASKASIILSMESLFAAVFSVTLGYDGLRSGLFLGGAAIMFSVVMTEPLFWKRIMKR